MPAMMPEFAFTDHVTELFGPPSGPRSGSTPARQSAAWRVRLSARLENPATHVRSLMLLPRLLMPPNDGKLVMVYCGCCEAANNPQLIAINKIDNEMRRLLS